MDRNSHDHNLMMAAHWSSVDALQLEQADAEQAKQALSAIGSVADAHVDRRNAINGDGDLSQTGRDAKVRALIDQSDKDLQKIAAPVINKLEAKIHESTRAMAVATSTAPTTNDTLRHIEIRGLLAGTDQLTLESNLEMLALNGNDDECLHAVLTAPKVAELIRPATATRIRALMAARIEPDHAATADKAGETLALVNNAVRTAAHAICTPAARAALGIDAIALSAKAPSVPRSDAPGA